MKGSGKNPGDLERTVSERFTYDFQRQIFTIMVGDIGNRAVNNIVTANAFFVGHSQMWNSTGKDQLNKAEIDRTGFFLSRIIDKSPQGIGDVRMDIFSWNDRICGTKMCQSVLIHSCQSSFCQQRDNPVSVLTEHLIMMDQMGKDKSNISTVQFKKLFTDTYDHGSFQHIQDFQVRMYVRWNMLCLSAAYAQLFLCLNKMKMHNKTPFCKIWLINNGF